MAGFPSDRPGPSGFRMAVPKGAPHPVTAGLQCPDPRVAHVALSSSQSPGTPGAGRPLGLRCCHLPSHPPFTPWLSWTGRGTARLHGELLGGICGLSECASRWYRAGEGWEGSPAGAEGQRAHTGCQAAVETSGGGQAEDADDHIGCGTGQGGAGRGRSQESSYGGEAPGRGSGGWVGNAPRWS